MALTVTALGTINSTSNLATYPSGTLTPGAAGRAVFAVVSVAEATGTVPHPTLKNHSALPFQFLGNGVGTHPITSGTNLLGIWGCLATGTTADTVDVDFDGNTQAACNASFFEVSGFDATPTSIGEAVIQLETATVASGTSASITLDAFADADNIYAYGLAVLLPATENFVPEASATEIHDIGIGSPNTSLFTSWKANDASPSATWTNSAAGLQLAIEVNSTGTVAGTDDHIVHQQFYNEAGSGTALAFTPSSAPTTGNTLVFCVTIEHFETPTYTPGNGYTLMVDPAGPTNMNYEVGNSTFDRQIWYSKVADGDDNPELASSTGTGGWNLSYWELAGEFEVSTVVTTYSGASAVRVTDPAAIADPGSSDIAYLSVWSAIHFEAAADPVDFSGINTSHMIDRGDIASTGGTKCQTSAADKSVSNGHILNQDVVVSANAISTRVTTVAFTPVAGDVTVTPATVAVVDTVPTPAALAASVVTPATVAMVDTVPTPIPGVPATVTPAEVAVIDTVPTPAVLAASVVTPATVAMVDTVPTPAILAAATVEPGVVAMVTTVPTPTIDVGGGPVTVTPATVTSVFAVDTPTVTAGATVTPAVVAAVVTVPTPTVTAGAVVEPNVVALVHTVPTPTTAAGATVAPATVTVTHTVPTPLAGLIVVIITARLDAMFYRNTTKTQLALVPIGNSQPIGFRNSEEWEKVSSRFTLNQGTHDTVMGLMTSVWAAHSLSNQATLTTAINTALQVAGYRAPGGFDLV